MKLPSGSCLIHQQLWVDCWARKGRRCHSSRCRTALSVLELVARGARTFRLTARKLSLRRFNAVRGIEEGPLESKKRIDLGDVQISSSACSSSNGISFKPNNNAPGPLSHCHNVDRSGDAGRRHPCQAEERRFDSDRSDARRKSGHPPYWAAEDEAAGEGKPRQLSMQILDMASGVLMAFGAVPTLRKQQRDGIS
jgi:hypothetical protein